MENLYRIACNEQMKERMKAVTISETDYKELFPKLSAKKLTFMFLNGYVLLLSATISEFLLERYPELAAYDDEGNIISQKDDLEGLDFTQLILEAYRYKINTRNKNEFELRISIRQARMEHNRKSA